MSGLSPQQVQQFTQLTLDDDAVLARAAQITALRTQQTTEDAQTEQRRLLRQYAQWFHAQWFHPERHHLNSGTLCPEEHLLVMALERNKFTATVERGRATWSGDAECTHHLWAGATVLFAGSRVEVLTGLWGVVSGQRGWQVHVDEHHLRGSVVQTDIRGLRAELRAQEAAEQQA
ncbi:hypothetical protein DESA109040_02440 [Deinococcus saxicola]|uniref:hypothetical protein n=1 Tax=Deinococcus saxicola TaxID=249406 RepID=UPI0039EFCBC7